MSLKTKNIDIEIKAVAEDGSFEGYGAAFNNVDSYGDVIVKGAFAKTIKERKNKIRMFWNHNSSHVIGVFDEMKEDNNGLYVKGRLALGTQKGREAYELLQMGAVDSMSIGYKTIKDEYDRQKNIRYLKELKLYEMSIVSIPANEDATITNVKSLFDDLDNEKKEEVIKFISSLESHDEPQDNSLDASVGAEEEKDATVDEHSEDQTADNENKEDPLDDVKQSLENLMKTMKGD